jgi:hypothetical protein
MTAIDYAENAPLKIALVFTTACFGRFDRPHPSQINQLRGAQAPRHGRIGEVGLARIAVAADAIDGTHVLSFPKDGRTCSDGGKSWTAREMTDRQFLVMDRENNLSCSWRIVTSPSGVPGADRAPRHKVCIVEDKSK